MDPFTYRDQASKQKRIDDSWLKQKHSIGRAVLKFFHFGNILAHAANSPYYHSMVNTIQRNDPSVDPSTPYEIGNKYLEEMEELKAYISDFKDQWKLYDMTVMCDNLTRPTNMTLFNFLVYYDRKIVYHQSFDAIGQIQDHWYLLELMTKVIRCRAEVYDVAGDR